MNRAALQAAFNLAVSLPVRTHHGSPRLPQIPKKPRVYWREAKRRQRRAVK